MHQTTYGFRIARGGEVYAFTAPAYHGRVGKADEVLAGYVKRDGRKWRNDQCSDLFTTQAQAARILMRIVFGAES